MTLKQRIFHPSTAFFGIGTASGVLGALHLPALTAFLGMGLGLGCLAIAVTMFNVPLDQFGDG